MACALFDPKLPYGTLDQKTSWGAAFTQKFAEGYSACQVTPPFGVKVVNAEDDNTAICDSIAECSTCVLQADNAANEEAILDGYIKCVMDTPSPNVKSKNSLDGGWIVLIVVGSVLVTIAIIIGIFIGVKKSRH
jgi:hypothetical protein